MDIRIIRTVVLLACAAPAAWPQGIITTVAGVSTCCNSSDGRAATSTWIPSLEGIVFDRQGNLYYYEAGSFKVRKVSTAGIVSTVAGNGTFGYSGDGGPAINAQLFGGGNGAGLAVDGQGNLYISDSQNHAIRKVDAAGIIRTVAGNGTLGFTGDRGPATQAQLYYPAGIAVDGPGNLYIADSSNNRVRKVDTAGIITTYAGNGNVAYSGDGVAATATAVDRPISVAVDSLGNLYISESSSNRVRRVDANGIIATVAGLTRGTRGFSGDGGPASAAMLAGPIGLTADGSGNLFIADNGNGRIRKVDAAGTISTIAGITGTASTPIGDGGPSTSAFLGVPLGVAFDLSGNLHISGSAAGIHRVRKIAAAAGLTATPSTVSFAYTIGGALPASQTVSVTSTGGATAFSASTATPWLSVSPGAATTPATITVSVNPAGLAGGTYQGAVSLTPTSPPGSAQTFAVTLTVTGAGAPVISAGGIVNASGYQTTLAPDTVFVIFGARMGPVATAVADAPNYPNALGGTSITFTPANGGAAIPARMVYSADGQVAGLLPSSIAPGTYAVRVIYNTLTSAPQNVTVVARSFGIATANSAGTGTVQATIANINAGISLTRFTSGSVAFAGRNWTLSPAHPGETVLLWGTGGGADPQNDTGGSSGDQTAAGNFAVLVGGRSIRPDYAGTSFGYPGLWQINFTLPADIAQGCFLTIQVSAGGELSNQGLLPVAAAGQDACSEPGLSKDALSAMDGGGTIVIGGFGVSKLTQTTVTTQTPGGPASTLVASQESIGGGLYTITAAAFAAANGGIRIGPCVVKDTTAAADKNPAAPQAYLNLGNTVPVAGPNLAANAAMGISVANPGPVYSTVFPNGTLANGGRYSVNAAGGRDVGAFSVSVNLPASFTVTNFDALTVIDRGKPLTINWTSSGAEQVFIVVSTSQILGKNASNVNIIRNVSFTCQVPAPPGTYTIPAAVLSYLLPEGIDTASLAKGSGILAVEAVNEQTFTPPLLVSQPFGFAGFAGVIAFGRNLIVQ